MQSTDERHVRPDRPGSPPGPQHDAGQLDPAPPLADEADGTVGCGSRLEGAAVRNQSPGEVPRDDAPEVPPHDVLGSVIQVAGVEAGTELSELSRP